MSLFRNGHTRGFGLKFANAPTSYGMERLPLGDHVAIPSEFLEHLNDIPKVNGRRVIQDQGPSSSCVMQSFGAAIHLMETRKGLPFDPVSIRFGYYNSRRIHNSHLVDSGTYLHTCADGLRRFGVCSDKFWKWAPGWTKIAKRPNWTATRNAHPRRAGKYVRIYEFAERIPAIQRVILSGYDVAFGTRVAQSFLASAGSPIIDRPSVTDPIAGNHAMLIIGWKMIGGILYFLVLNSWSDEWREEGLCWMSADYIGAQYTDDLHVIHGWERLQAA